MKNSVNDYGSFMDDCRLKYTSPTRWVRLSAAGSGDGAAVIQLEIDPHQQIIAGHGIAWPDHPHRRVEHNHFRNLPGLPDKARKSGRAAGVGRRQDISAQRGDHARHHDQESDQGQTGHAILRCAGCKIVTSLT